MSLLLDKLVTCNCNSIVVPFESYLCLKDRYHYSKVKKHYTDTEIEKLKSNYDNKSNRSVIGLNQLLDGDFNMSVSTMKNILDSKNLPYEDGGIVECISV